MVDGFGYALSLNVSLGDNGTQSKSCSLSSNGEQYCSIVPNLTIASSLLTRLSEDVRNDAMFYLDPLCSSLPRENRSMPYFVR